jgi:hypothetical protein
MKRKLLLFAVLVASCTTLFGQVFVWEGFDGGQMPPTGWSLQGYPDQWSVSVSNNAGGSAPEAMFTYYNATGTSRLISPTYDLTGFTTIKLSFRHFYDWYANGPTIGLATRANNGTWHDVWKITPTGNSGPSQLDFDVSNSDVGSSSFQFCFYISGNLYNVDYWYLDNILMFNPLNLDAGMLSIGTEKYFTSKAPVTGTIMNFGLTAISSLEINWQLDGAGTVYSSTFTGLSIPTLGNYSFTCTDSVDAPIGEHNLAVWINQVNGAPDNDSGNDTLSKDLYKVCFNVYRPPCFEEFTSSTCSPCAAFNTGFVPWCEAHAGEITLIKYQMNWPGAGDPYYTAEGGDRRNYYGVSWVPWLVTNGTFTNTDMTEVQSVFDEQSAKPGLLKIASTHTITGTNISVTTDILPFANFSNMRVHVIVFENVTTQNTGGNGETEFHHVMMKMMPDANGTTVNFTDRNPYTLTLSADLSGTNVEEYDDLGVIIIIQDYSSKEIFQSAYSVQDKTYNTEAHLSGINVDGNPLAGFDQNVFSYDMTLAEGSTVIPVVTATPVDPNATVIIVPTLSLPGETTIDVFSEDLMTHLSYGVNFHLPGVGLDEKNNSARVYPNPSRGMVYIMGAEHSLISVTSTSGVEWLRMNDFSGTTLNLSNLPDGVYSINIRKTDGSMINKKIVIVK